MGIDGLGALSAGGTGAPANEALVADLDNLGLQVNKDNVLNVHKLLYSEVLRLRTGMRQQDYKFVMGECGTDPVSPEAAQAFTAKMTRLRDHCNNYVDILASAAEQLNQNARTYGYTEEQIKASMSAVSTGQQPAPAIATPSATSGPLVPRPSGSVRPITIDPSRTPRIPGLKVDL